MLFHGVYKKLRPADATSTDLIFVLIKQLNSRNTYQKKLSSKILLENKISEQLECSARLRRQSHKCRPMWLRSDHRFIKVTNPFGKDKKLLPKKQ